MSKNTSEDTATESHFFQILVEARSQRFPSARALFQRRKFSFSYGTYILFERGERIPSAAQLSEIIHSFDISPERLMLAWAAAQFSEPELSAVFRERFTEMAGHSEPKGSDISQPSFDSTWVLNKRDIEEILREPWVWDAISDIVTAFPDGLHGAVLEKRFGRSSVELRDRFLKRWIKNEDIRYVDGRFVPTMAYVYLPATQDSDKIRNETISVAAQSMIARIPLTGGLSVKRMVRVRLTEKIARDWATRLERLTGDLFDAGAKGGARKQLYELILMFGAKD